MKRKFNHIKEGKKMTRRFFSFLLAFLLCVSMLPVSTMTVHAETADEETTDEETTEYAATVTVGDAETSYSTVNDAFTYANSLSDASTITLLKDCDTSKTLTVSSSGGITLDLAGHTLNAASSSIYVLTIYIRCTLTLKDSSEAGTGTISGGSAGVYGSTSSVFNMESGTITGGTRYGGVYISQGTFNMNGGTITKNSGYAGVYLSGSNTEANITGGTISENTGTYAGGVYLTTSSGKVNMTGGTISNNTGTGSSSSGGIYINGSSAVLNIEGGTISNNTGVLTGGVYAVGSSSKVNMTGGTISNNIGTGSSSSGGIYFANQGELVMSGGTISDNTGVLAGGVCKNSSSNSVGITITGGTISGNIATGSTGAGGIYSGWAARIAGGEVTGNTGTYGGIYTSKNLRISGSPVIAENKQSSDSEDERNVYLPSGKMVILEGEMQDDAEVGITLQDTPGNGYVQLTSVESGTEYYKNAINYLSSDQGYYVWINSSGYLEMSLYGFSIQPETTYYLTDMEAEALTAVANSFLGNDFSYQWYSNTESSSTGGEKIEGATASTYTPSTSQAGSTWYYCVVTDKTDLEDYPSNAVQVIVKNNYAAEVTIDDDSESKTTSYYTLEDAFNAANEVDSATITMLEDYEISAFLKVSSGSNISLDLNGHTLSCAYSSSSTMISVSGGFKLMDSSTGATGKIMGKGASLSYGIVSLDNSTGATFEMEGGTLTGSCSTYGVVHVGLNATFKMKGGTITGNSVTNGAVWLSSSGVFIMEGGTISKNESNGSCGGVYVSSTATFNLSGNPVIANNMAEGETSNVYLVSNARITLAGQLEEGTDIGIKPGSKLSIYDSYQITSTEDETNYYATAVKYFTSDDGYVVRTNDSGYVEMYYALNATAPVITEQPQGNCYVVNSIAEALKVQASVYDGGELSYQWYSNSVDSTEGATAIKDATESSYTPSMSAAGTVYYYCVVTNTNTESSIDGERQMAAVSDAAQIIVSENAQTPSVTVQPQDGVYLEDGQAAVLSVEAAVTDSGTLSYQWYSNSVNSTEGATAIEDATENTYLPSTSGSGTTYYYCVVTNTNERATGKTVAETVSDIAKVTVVSSGSVAVDNGSELKTYNNVGKAFTYANSLSESSTVTLLENCKIDDTLMVDSGKDITLDLAGKTLTAEEGATISILTVEGTLRLADSSGDNSGKISGGSRGVYLSEADSVLEMNGGTISENGSTSIQGSAIYGGSNGTFTMNGGVICDNAASGAAVRVGTFTMTDGEISSNVGGNVYAVTASMNGGKLSNSSGTGITVTDSFSMKGGEICNNASGGVVSSNAFTMSGGKISENGNTGVYLRGTSFTMTGGEISGNSGSTGGGVYIRDDSGNGTYIMSGGKISGNTASSGAGVYFYTKGTGMTMAGGEISGNTSTESGGGIYVQGSSTTSKAVFTMTGGSISDNSGTLGGGIYSQQATVYLVNGTISENHGTQGGGIYMLAYVTLNVTGGKIINNEATLYGGGIYLYKPYTTTTSTVNLSRTPVISGNTLVETDEEGNEIHSANNVYLQNAQYINLSGKLTENAEVGITTEIAPSDDSRVEITAKESTTEYYKTSGQFFTSDTGCYMWENEISGYVELGNYAANISSDYQYYLVDDKADALSVEASSVLGSDLKYQWYSSASNSNEGGTAIPNAVSEEYVPSTTSPGITWYYCVVSSGSGDEVIAYPSNVIKVTVTDDYTVTVTTIEDSETVTQKYLTVREAFDYANSLSTAATITLLTDFDLKDTLTVASGKNITLDLNGKNLKGMGARISILTVSGTLTLTDSSEDADGKITGGLGTDFGSSTAGGGVYVTGGRFTMSGGTISDNVAGGGGGVFVRSGSFTLNGGTISNNVATVESEDDNSDSEMGGGGVCIYNGSFTMSGGSISNNTAGDGGGIYAYSATITGGEICDNTAVKGGGIYAFTSLGVSNCTIVGNNAEIGGGIYQVSSSLTITNASIRENWADSRGGGVYINADPYYNASVSMDGGEIQENEAGENGGGIYVSRYSSKRYGTLSVSGSSIITGNTVGEKPNNVYLPADQTLSITGELNEDANIGVTTATLPADGSTVQITKSNTGSYSYMNDGMLKAIKSDDVGYGVRWGGAYYLVLYETADTGDLEEPVVTVSDSADTSSFKTINEAFAYANSLDTASKITLLSDCSTSYETLTVAVDREITLDLNGHTLNTPEDAMISVLTVKGTLTLEDNSDDGDGIVTGGVGNVVGSLHGGGVYVADGGIFNLKSGAISGNGSDISYTCGGGVYVAPNGAFTMLGGEISNNTLSGSIGHGGGVYVDSEGTFTMLGGEISNNNASSFGGGVYVASKGAFTLNDGIISGNSGSQGGGVYESSGEFTMTGGAISGNSGTLGGGACVVNGKFTMTGGKITANTASSSGSGVYASSSVNVTISGAPVISGNTSDNLYLQSVGNVITLADSLSDGAAIGITLRSAPTADSPVAITAAESDTSYYASAEQYITADNALYGIHSNTSDGYLELYLVTDSTDAAAPVITETQMEEASYTYGDSADKVTALSVTADDLTSGTLSYQWYSSDSADGEGTAIEGATGAAFTPSTAEAGTLYYYCVVTNKDSSATIHQIATVTTDRAAVTVNKAAPQITLSDKEASYTGEAVSIDAAKVTLLGEETVPEDVQITYTYYSDETCETALEAEPAEVGVYYVKASLPAFGNYNAAQSEAAKLTITKGFNEAGVSATGYTGTYDAQSHEGITVTLSGAAQGAEVTYKTSESAQYSSEVPAFVEAGTYTVYFKVSKDSYNDVEGSVSVVINKATQSVSFAQTEVSKAATDAAFTNELTKELVYGAVTWSSSDTSVAAVNEATGEVTLLKAGETTITATAEGSDSYTAAKASYKLTVADSAFGESDVTAEGYSVTYDGQSHRGITVTLAGAAADATVTYKTDEDAAYTTTVPTFTDAGTYTVYYKVSKTNYSDVTGSVSVVIRKAAQSISFAQEEISKVATDAAFTNELTKNLVYGAVTWSSSNESVAVVDEATGEVTLQGAGVATITATAEGSNNYTTAKASYTLTVADAVFGESDITVEEYSGVYDGEAHAAPITLTGAADGATVTYKTDADAEYTEDVPVFTDAGTYTVYYKVSKANYSDVTGSVKVIIGKADSELSFSEDTVSITTSDTSFSITLEGQIYGDLTWESSDTSVAAVDEDGSVTILGAGSAVITATASGDENHNGTSASYTITIADTTGDTIRTNEDGSLGYYVDGVLQTEFTGLLDMDDVSYYVEDGIVQTEFTGTVDDGETTWYVVNGIVQTNYSGVTQTGDTGYYVVNGEVQTNYTGTVQSGDTWYYVVSGVVSTSYNGFVECGDDWFYFENGSIVTAGYNNRGTDVVKGTIDGMTGWYYVENGKYIPSYTGFASNKNGDWYVEKGIVSFKTSSVIKDTTGAIGAKGTWYYVVGNRVRTDYTGVANYKNANGWWYIKNGQVDFTYTGFSTNSKGSWYVQKGKVTFAMSSVIKDTTGAIGTKGTWYYVVRSRVRTDYTGVANYKNTNGWWYIKAGKVDFSFTGLASNNNGRWYVKGGKVQLGYSGKVKINGKTYTVKNGRVG